MDELKNLSQQDLQALKEKYEYTSRVFPDSESLLALAEVYLALRQVTKARKTVSDFTLNKGDSSRARFVLAKAHLMCWNATEAEEELRKALELDPRDSRASKLLTYIYGSNGKIGEAFRISLFSSSGSLSQGEKLRKPREPSPAVEKKSKPRAGIFETDTMLNLYVSQGLYEDALRIVKVLCELDPDNPLYRSKREEIISLLVK